jgi:predicted HicB family RNase H-like nuclease
VTVTKWPSYLLRGVPEDTRALLSEQAQADDVSLADVVRQALCHHYNMDCDTVSFGYQPQLDTDGDVLLVRIQPEVWRKLKKEAGQTKSTPAKYGRTKQIILQSISDYMEATQG